jgi:NDP-sugar pyrophosphorylase family protein
MEITPDVAVSLERDVIPYLIADGIFGYQCSGAFIDIGIPEEYERAQMFFSKNKKGKS